MKIQKLKLGTRKSLLAWAQSSWVARSLEAAHPGLSVELVGIVTQGDKILDKPLSQIDGKEFFTAELDHALLNGDVDLTVHSMKDLSLDRPPQLTLAATPKRELQHDIIVFHESVVARLKAGEEIRVGTSSPRRLTLVPEFLKNALPRFSPTQSPRLRFVEIRGNVNTRLGRIRELEGTERKLDAVVLAFAGLERLAMDSTASLELWKLFENTLIMIPPLKECPSAPAQGALAIEARADRTEIVSLIRVMHDQATLDAVTAEREVLNEWGGGCHQKLGASAVNGVIHIKGQKKSGEFVTELRGEKTPSHDFTRIEAADVFDFSKHEMTSSEKKVLIDSALVFIAHSRAFDYLDQKQILNKKRIWVSGTKSWYKLAAAGVWVEGSLEGKGFDSMVEFKAKKLLRMGTEPFAFLTHVESAELAMPLAETAHVATYQHQFREIPQKLSNSERLYWTSGLPFQVIWSKASGDQRDVLMKKTHACGPGKTATVLKAHGISPTLFRE
jgi:hydroxymethylbilane synthase